MCVEPLVHPACTSVNAACVPPSRWSFRCKRCICVEPLVPPRLYLGVCCLCTFFLEPRYLASSLSLFPELLGGRANTLLKHLVVRLKVFLLGRLYIFLAGAASNVYLVGATTAWPSRLRMSSWSMQRPCLLGFFGSRVF